MKKGTVQDPAFESMVNEYYHEIYGTAYRLTGNQADADDLVQETFKNVLKAVSSGTIVENPRAYLVTTLKNTFYRNLRILQKEQSAENIENFIEAHQLDDLNPSAEIDSGAIQQALSRLDQTYRFPLVLFYYNEFSYEEIAKLLEIPIGTVMSRLSRGKRYLKLALSGLFEKSRTG